ncbi:MAG: hypothetical protein EA385_15050 [Salinarimonadaceae bacterium]|nr:MAG: hypothetical protein EA385_15050 [Salinarimonadaceae bacterium]
MPTPFAQLESAASVVVDSLHAETTRLIPRVAGEFVAGGADASRVERDIQGIVDFNPEIARAKEKRQYDGHRPEVDGEKVHISYRVPALGLPATWPRAKDHIRAEDRPGKPVFQVVTVEPDGIGRLVCRCVPLS